MDLKRWPATPGLCLRSEGGRFATSARVNTREHQGDDTKMVGKIVKNGHSAREVCRNERWCGVTLLKIMFSKVPICL